MQISFTLPLPVGAEAKEAARLYLEKLGLERVEISCMEPMGDEFSFFVAYGHATHDIDVTRIHVPKPEHPQLPHQELLRLAQKIGRPIVIVGGTTGSDAHTVGIDAILSMKGIAGDKGLESYPIFQVTNLRAQVSHEDLIRRASELKADAILVSKIVTQQDQHLKGLKELFALLKKDKRLNPHLIKIAGGPRLDHRIARSVGFDAGFGPGTKPSEVANYIVHELVRRVKGETSTQKGSLWGKLFH